jgi:hypothetical protein
MDQDGAELHTFSSSNQAYWDAAADLKVQWKIWPLQSDDTCDTKQVKLEYSLNNGSTWSAIFLMIRRPPRSTQSGTSTKSGIISTSQDLSKVRIRMIVRCESCSPCDDGGDPGDPKFCCNEYDSELGRWIRYTVTDCNNCELSSCDGGAC